jgi:cyclopropane fatty-acyl-phospholipid synthase-like methyltransferase
LEIGIGPGGGMIPTLACHGHFGQGIDVSKEAVEQARTRIQDCPDTISLAARDFWTIDNQFDLVLALDFLEHFEDDAAVIKKMHSLTKTGGSVILCVPAREKKWDETDRWAGHFRRYEKDNLIKKLSEANLYCEAVWSFGFPLLNIATIVRNYLLAKQNKRNAYIDQYDQAKRTVLSGNTALEETRWKIFFNDFWLTPFKLLQKPFLQRDWGVSYIVKALRIQ